jgi:hypothetical protein
MIQIIHVKNSFSAVVCKVIFIGICELLSRNESYAMQERQQDFQNGLVENNGNGEVLDEKVTFLLRVQLPELSSPFNNCLRHSFE